MAKKISIDVKDFKDKIDCIVRNIEDNSKVHGEIKGGTVKDLGEEFVRQYKRLRPHKRGWKLRKIKYMPMLKKSLSKDVK